MIEKSRKCPVCGLVSTRDYQPFCSAYCSDLDLSHWLNGNYCIPEQELFFEEKKFENSELTEVDTIESFEEKNIKDQ